MRESNAESIKTVRFLAYDESRLVEESWLTQYGAVCRGEDLFSLSAITHYYINDKKFAAHFCEETAQKFESALKKGRI